MLKVLYYWILFGPCLLFVLPRKVCQLYKYQVTFVLGPFSWFVFAWMYLFETWIIPSIDSVTHYFKSKNWWTE